MKPHPSPPCVVAPSGDPQNSFLHIAELPRDDKTKWITAANTAGLPLAEWVQLALNRAAEIELADAKKKTTAPKDQPPVA